MMVKNHQSPEFEVLLLDRVNEIFCSASPSPNRFQPVTPPATEGEASSSEDQASSYSAEENMSDLWGN